MAPVRLLDAYLLRRYIHSLTLTILGLLLIAVVVDLTENIDTFIDHEARPSQVLYYYLYHTPYWIILTLPVATLLGTLFALSAMARRNEITAMKSAGVSLYRLLLPIFGCALVFSALAFLFTDRIVPAATYRCNSVRDEIRSQDRSDGSRRQVLLQDVDGQLIFAGSYDAGTRQGRDILWERHRDSRVSERRSARRLRWHSEHWLLLEGHTYRFADSGLQVSSFDTLELKQLTLEPEDFARQQKKPEEMNYGELQSYIRRARANGEDTTRHLVDLHLKISFPVTCFVIVLLGAPLGANARRTGLANSFGIGILICFVFYSCVKMGQALGWNQVLTPLLGAWLANIIFAVLSLILLWRAHK